MGDMDRSGERPAPEQFLGEHATPRWARLVAEAQRRLGEARRELDDLRGATATICWAVDGFPRAYMNIRDGVMEIGTAPDGDVLMTAQMSAADWDVFVSGAVQTGFLDAPSGRRGFGKSRIERLRGIRGTLRFIFSGLPGGVDWTCTLALGGEPTAEPQATISIAAETLAQIRSGQIEAQMAFLQGRVKVAGDAGLVMQLGMAMFM